MVKIYEENQENFMFSQDFLDATVEIGQIIQSLIDRGIIADQEYVLSSVSNLMQEAYRKQKKTIFSHI